MCGIATHAVRCSIQATLATPELTIVESAVGCVAQPRTRLDGHTGYACYTLILGFIQATACYGVLAVICSFDENNFITYFYTIYFF